MNEDEKKVDQIRTSAQNRAMHLWFTAIARELNEAGITMEDYVHTQQLEHTYESVKAVYRQWATKKWGHTSTTQLTMSQMNELYDEMVRHLADITARTNKEIKHTDFPSQEMLNWINEDIAKYESTKKQTRTGVAKNRHR